MGYLPRRDIQWGEQWKRGFLEDICRLQLNCEKLTPTVQQDVKLPKKPTVQ
jgi:hypothetical protein